MTVIKTISVEECLKVNTRTKSKWIDIRTDGEYLREHIEGAENIEINDLTNKNFGSYDTVIFYCQSGNRTHHAESILKKLNVSTIYILKGGINAWKRAKQPTKINKKSPIPIMNQVQIIAGSLIILGIILSYSINPFFNLLSGFVGCGLLFAGVSRTCMLAKILMLLPYNKTKN